MGRIETGEAAPAAAVRELTEETVLTARVEDVYVINVLHYDRLDSATILGVSADLYGRFVGTG